jgi:predicted NAD-dependent protein-ADP-ribosyltransferase YbiA (DUF1768 family)
VAVTFHPAKLGAFSDEGRHWPSIAHHVLVKQLAREADREKVRQTFELAEAKKLASPMERVPGAGPTLESLVHALSCLYEQRLDLRALLVGTGDEPIEARLDEPGGDENLLGRALMQVRSRVRVRANDPDAVQCQHQERTELGLTCEHALAFAPHSGSVIHRRFTGMNTDHVLLCARCVEALPAAAPLRKVCRACLRGLLGTLSRGPDVGAPAHATRASSLRFSHRLIDGPRDVVAFAPIARQPHTWLLLDRAGRFHRLDTERGIAEAGGSLDPAEIELDGPLVLVVAPGGELAAVGEATKRRAVVLEPVSGRITHRLTRDDYHPEHCYFPLGFFELEGRLLLVHATEWNRLDVIDARTGALLTARTAGAGPGQKSPEHALDYFHSDLHVSPEGTRVIDNGWIWHPYGQVRVFSLARWVRENPWESEDGPSVRPLAGRAYFWDGPVCWLDENTVAVWGDGEDADELTPAAILYDAESGEELRRFPGPAAGFASVVPYLIASDAQGTQVWDPRTGEQLLHDPSFSGIAAHPRSQELLSRSDGGWRVSRLG